MHTQSTDLPRGFLTTPLTQQKTDLNRLNDSLYAAVTISRRTPASKIIRRYRSIVARWPSLTHRSNPSRSQESASLNARDSSSASCVLDRPAKCSATLRSSSVGVSIGHSFSATRPSIGTQLVGNRGFHFGGVVPSVARRPVCSDGDALRNNTSHWARPVFRYRSMLGITSR